MHPASELLQHLLREHAAAAEPDPLIDQVKQDVFSLLADHGQVAHVDDELTVAQVHSGPVARGLQFSRPRRNELALDNQSPLIPTFENRDPQHRRLTSGIGKARHMPNKKSRNFMILQHGGKQWRGESGLSNGFRQGWAIPDIRRPANQQAWLSG